MTIWRDGPTPHLTWRELDCKDGTPYPDMWRLPRAVNLAVEFERVRAVVGGPIIIGSAYRTTAYNRKVGGAERSQHCQGRALDLYPPAGWTVHRFYEAIRAIAKERGSHLFGLGLYPTFVHIDTRPRPAHGRLILWEGTRAWAEVKDGKQAA
jgi:hypothetical protein